jgi:DNA-binding CsgD family transcriptional regulator
VLARFVELVQGDELLSPKWRRGAWTLAGESLFVAGDERVRTARRMGDVGTGAGFPGLVLATLLPQARVSLIEIKADRHRFLREAIDALGLTNVEVVTVSAQEWADGIGACDLVTTRNVGKLPTVVELVAPLLSVGGTALLWTGPGAPGADADGDAAGAATGLRREDARLLARKAHLYRFVKVAETPPMFPRAGGAAFRDPIRAPVNQEGEPPDPASVQLGPLERQVLELLVARVSFPEMAERTGLPVATLRRESRRVCRKLQVRTRKDAIARAEQAELFAPEHR